MNFEELLKTAKDSWEKRKPTLTHDEIKRISGKEGVANFLVGFMTSEYYKRKKLIFEGDLTIGYVFKMFLETSEEGNDICPTWVLFSPSSSVFNNPEKLLAVYEKLQQECERKDHSLPKPLYYALTSMYASGAYIQIPPQFTNGDLVYLSIAYEYRRATPDFKLGYNLMLASRGISKGVLYLPPQYWSKEWAEFYSRKEK
ncbi:MAG: hypothetical protein MJ239_04330 [Bacilli bacterium]|nr:hypothetical protein [Bacilli bacterium]